MKRISLIVFTILLTIIPSILLAAPRLPFSSVTFQSRDYGSQSDGLGFVGSVSGSANNDTLVIDTWLWRGSYVDPDSVARNSFDWPSGTNGDHAFVGGQWYLMVTETSDSSTPLGEFSPITRWDASTGEVIVSPVFSATVAQYEHVAIIHRSQIPRSGQISQTVTAATGADSTTLFTAVGNVWLTSLSAEITTIWASTADSVGFIYDAPVATNINRIDKGEEWNAAAVGSYFHVNSATLGTATLTDVGIPVPDPLWYLFIPDGTIIKIVTRGNATSGVARCDATWMSLEPGSYLRK